MLYNYFVQNLIDKIIIIVRGNTIPTKINIVIENNFL